jgi:hypothetical protein
MFQLVLWPGLLPLLLSITRELFSGWEEEMNKIERKEKKMMEGGLME